MLLSSLITLGLDVVMMIDEGSYIVINVLCNLYVCAYRCVILVLDEAWQCCAVYMP